MARIAGVDLPRDKRIEFALTYIYGIGLTSAKKIVAQAGIAPTTRVRELTEGETVRVREILEKDFRVEGDLRREFALSIRRLIEIGCYQGHSSSARPARPWSAHQDQRPVPQGAESAP